MYYLLTLFCSSFSAVMLIHSNPLCVTQNWNMNLAYLPLRKWLHQQFRLHGNRFLLISSSGSLPLGYIQLNSNCPQRQKWREGDFYWVKVGNSCSSPYSDEYIIIYSKHLFFFPPGKRGHSEAPPGARIIIFWLVSLSLKMFSLMKELEDTDAALITCFPELFVQDKTHSELAYF